MIEVLMPLNLPEPDHAPLGRSPLALVVCQVKVEENLLLAEPSMALQLKRLLSNRYPKLNRAAGQQMRLIQRSGGQPVERVEVAGQRGHQLASEDGTWIVTLSADSFSLETTAYTTWRDTFSERFSELVRGVAEVVHPVLESRLGLRYVNVIRGSHVASRALKAPQEFKGSIAPSLLGPLGDPPFAEAALDMDGRCVFGLEGGASLAARYGTVLSTDEELSFLLDLDAYREEGRAFDSDGISKAVGEFNRVITSFFQQSLTREAMKKLKES